MLVQPATILVEVDTVRVSSYVATETAGKHTHLIQIQHGIQ